MSDDVVLEQRDRKQRRAAATEENGHAPDVPDFAAAEDFAGPDVPAGDSTDAPAQEDVEDSATSSNRIFFVRIPRPPIDDDLVKRLSAQFQDQVAKVKAVSARLATKREELRELRNQKSIGYSLKLDSKPEYGEKLDRMRQLRDLRRDYRRRIDEITSNLRGLECKSEEELDAKVKELQYQITHEGLSLRDEKTAVHKISKLQSQRAQTREYQSQEGVLKELKAEIEKVDATLKEMDGEFKILHNEREQASGIIKEIKSKIEACEEEAKDITEELEAAKAVKDNALAALEKARTELNESMAEYRENRSFGLKVRDLVTAGQVEEARAMCAAQADAMVAKLGSDAAYRKEYYSLWAQQRKYAVSELLPDSTVAVKEAKPAANKANAKGNGAKAAKAPPPKPQGAEKAKLLIEQLMAEAQAEASRKAAGRPAADDVQSSGDADDELDFPAPVAEAPAVPVPEAVKPRAAASARPADLLKMVELPKIEDEEFVPPVLKSEADKAAAAALDKERLREEQIKKAQEAELRKKKLAEAKEKKRKEAEAKKKADEEARKAQEAAVAEERAKQLAAERAEAEAKRKAQQEAARAAAEAKALSSNPAAKVIAKSQLTAVAKPVKRQTGNDLYAHWKALTKNTNVGLWAMAVILGIFLLALVIMAVRA